MNNDSVVRTVFHKYLHPKEVFISNGIINAGFVESIHRIGRKDVRGKCVRVLTCRGGAGCLLRHIGCALVSVHHRYRGVDAPD